MSSYRIPFNRPCLAGNEQAYIAQAITNGQISGDGAFTTKCRALLEREFGSTRTLLLDIQPGDEVIIPSFAFVSTANAFVLWGARPVFCDIRPDTLNLDEARIEQLITARTRAIVLVHYPGVGCGMDAILAIAACHHLAVVEDNAHGLFGRYKGRSLGTFGSQTSDCPMTKYVSDRLLRLPFYNDLSEPDQAWIVDAIQAFAGA